MERAVWEDKLYKPWHMWSVAPGGGSCADKNKTKAAFKTANHLQLDWVGIFLTNNLYHKALRKNKLCL